MELNERLFNGDRAREVLENEAFLGAFAAIKEEIAEQWMNSPARDQEGREKCWQYLMILNKVKAHLLQTLETGKLAKLELEHKRGIVERLKSVGSQR
jgi:hypothetical protein